MDVSNFWSSDVHRRKHVVQGFGVVTSTSRIVVLCHRMFVVVLWSGEIEIFYLGLMALLGSLSLD